MTHKPSELFCIAARALFGDAFKAPLARFLDVAVDRVDDWAKGRGNRPPQGVWYEVARELKKRGIDRPDLDVLLMEQGDYPTTRTYEIPGVCHIGVKAAADGTFPIVEYTATWPMGWWGRLQDHVRMLPENTAAFRLERDNKRGDPTLVHVLDAVRYPDGTLDVSAILGNAAPMRTIDADFDTVVLREFKSGRPVVRWSQDEQAKLQQRLDRFVGDRGLKRATIRVDDRYLGLVVSGRCTSADVGPLQTWLENEFAAKVRKGTST
jgi:hypothetical protein